MCVGFTKMQNFDPFDDKNFQFPIFGRNSMGNQQINSNKSGKRRFYTGEMNQHQNILLLSSPINLRHEFYACVHMCACKSFQPQKGTWHAIFYCTSFTIRTKYGIDCLLGDDDVLW